MAHTLDITGKPVDPLDNPELGVEDGANITINYINNQKIELDGVAPNEEEKNKVRKNSLKRKSIIPQEQIKYDLQSFNAEKIVDKGSHGQGSECVEVLNSDSRLDETADVHMQKKQAGDEIEAVIDMKWVHGSEMFLVKWRNLPYLPAHVQWFSRNQIGTIPNGEYCTRLFLKAIQQNNNGVYSAAGMVNGIGAKAITGQRNEIESILAHRTLVVSSTGDMTIEYLVKWKNLPNQFCSWHDEVTLTKRFPAQVVHFITRYLPRAGLDVADSEGNHGKSTHNRSTMPFSALKDQGVGNLEQNKDPRPGAHKSASSSKVLQSDDGKASASSSRRRIAPYDTFQRDRPLQHANVVVPTDPSSMHMVGFPGHYNPLPYHHQNLPHSSRAPPSHQPFLFPVGQPYPNMIFPSPPRMPHFLPYPNDALPHNHFPSAGGMMPLPVHGSQPHRNEKPPVNNPTKLADLKGSSRVAVLLRSVKQMMTTMLNEELEELHGISSRTTPMNSSLGMPQLSMDSMPYLYNPLPAQQVRYQLPYHPYKLPGGGGN